MRRGPGAVQSNSRAPGERDQDKGDQRFLMGGSALDRPGWEVLSEVADCEGDQAERPRYRRLEWCFGEVGALQLQGLACKVFAL